MSTAKAWLNLFIFTAFATFISGEFDGVITLGGVLIYGTLMYHINKNNQY